MDGWLLVSPGSVSAVLNGHLYGENPHFGGGSLHGLPLAY